MKRLIAIFLFLGALSLHSHTVFGQNNCASAQVISSIPFAQANLTTCGKGNDYQNYCGESRYMDGEDYLFSYTPSVSGCVNITLSNTLTYCAVFVFNGCPSTAGTTCVAQNTNNGNGNPSVGDVALSAGTTYYIMVDTWPDPTCSKFDISIINCPDGMSCNRPKTIPSLPFSETNTTCGAGADYGQLVGTAYAVCGPSFNEDGADFTYAYTPTRNQCLNISLSGIPAHKEDMSVVVTQGCPTASSSKCLALSEGSGTAGPPNITDLYVLAGSTIYITIDADDYYFSCTPFTLTIDTCALSLPQCGSSPMASDVCSGATAICDFTGYCGTTSSAYTADQPSNINSVFCGSIENNGWIKFVAGATTASFNVLFGNCTDGSGIQALVLEATNCTNFTVKSNCYEPQTGSGYGVITATNLVPGNTYLMMIDGFAGDHCDYIIQASSGVMIPVDAGPDQTICPGKSATLTANNGNNIYTWKPGNITSKSITVTPSATSDYIVESYSGNLGCPTPNTDTVRVNVMPTVTETKTVVDADVCTGACDGTAALNISGGVTPYTINWSHGPSAANVSSLCPGTTYTVIVTDNTGCQAKDTVIMPLALVANFSVTAPACGAFTGSVSTTATSGSGVFTYTGPGTLTITNTGGGNYSLSASSYGSYDITWTVSNSNCSKTITKTIKFNEIPTASFTAGAATCGSKTLNLTTTATVGSGNFTFTGPGAISFTNTGANTYSATASNYGTYDITWIVDNNGCQATATKSVTYTAQPTSAFVVSGPSCDSLNFTVTTTSSVGTGAWSFTGPSSAILNFTSTGANAYKANASQYGSYTVTWIVTNGVCRDSSTQNVTFYKKPVANAGLDQNLCGLSASLSASPSDGTGSWSQISGPVTATLSNASVANPTLSTTTYGSYTFRWTEVNGNCPASTDDVVILFSENPAGNAGSDQSICGLSATLNGTVTVGTGIWSGPGVATPTNPSSSASVITEGTVTYSWIVSNGACPQYTDDVKIDFHKQPTPNAGSNTSICGLSVVLDATPSTSAGQWIAPDSASFASATNPKTTASSPSYGTLYFVWQETNSPCPVTTDTVAITFVKSPSPQAGLDQSVCGLSATLSAAASPYSGSWSGAGNFSAPTNPNSGVTSTSYGAYSYVWTEFNAAPCPAKTDTVKITFIEQPVSDAGADQTLCGKTTNLAAKLSVATSTGFWTVPAGITLSNYNIINPVANAADFGTYTLFWTETNTAVCTPSTDSVVISFVPATSPDAGLDNQVCGSVYQLSAIPSFGFGSWTYSGPGILTFTSINDPNATITASAFGKYKLAWTEDNKPCVANTDTVLVTFFEAPLVDAGMSPDKVCGLNYILNATPSVGQGRWSWTPDNGVTGIISFKNGNDSIPDAKVSSSDYGRFFFIYTVVNGACTPPADTIDLTFYKRPVPDAGSDLVVCDTLQAQLQGNTSVVNAQWKWYSETAGTVTFNPGDNVPNPVAIASVPGTYKLFFSELNDPVCGTTTDSLTLTFLELPTVDAGADDLACGANYSFNASNPTFGTGKWTFVSSTDPSYIATFSDDTLYNTQATLNQAPTPGGVDLTFAWSVTNGICPPVSDTVVITFREVPNQVEAGLDQQLCNTLSTTISANDNGAIGSWSVLSAPSGAIGNFTSNSDEVTDFSGTLAGIYVLQRSASVVGCPNLVTDAVTIDFRTLPAPNAGSDNSVCDTIFTLQAAAPVGRITGVWTQISGSGVVVFSDSSLANSAITLIDAAYDSYQLVRTESNESCPDVTDTVEITFNEQTLANAGSDFEVCGYVFNMKAVPSPASASPHYTGIWSLSSGPGTVIMDPVLGNNPTTLMTVSDHGEYYFTWTETNGACPATTDEVKLLFVIPSQPEAGLYDTICGLVDTLSAIPSYGVGNWVNAPSNPAPVNFTNVSDPSSIITVMDYGQYRFDWLEANSPCFANSDYTFVTFHKQPVAYAGEDQDTCSLAAQLSAISSVSGTDYTGVWSGPVGSFFENPNDPNTIVHMDAVGYGQHTFIWTEINGSKCLAATDNVTINFLQTPVADAGVTPSQTCGTMLDLNAVSTVGMGSWLASGPGDLSFSDPTSATATAITDTYGSYQLVWQEINYGTNGGSCLSTDTFLVEFLPKPTAYAGLDSAVCGNQITLSTSKSVSASKVNWSVVGNPAAASIAFPDSVTSPVVLNTAFGSYQFVFTEDVASGICISKDTMQVIFVALPIANAGINDSVCNLVTTLNAAPSVGTGIWKSLTPGVIFNPDLSNPSPEITVPTFGQHLFIWKESNGYPCPVSTDTVSINFFKLPTPKAGTDFSVCGETATLNATPGANPGIWTINGSSTILFDDNKKPNAAITLVAASHSDYGLITLTYTESNNEVCSASDNVAVYFCENPKADAGGNQDVCGLNFFLSANPSVGIGTWSFNGNDTLISGFNGTNTPNASGTMNYYGLHGFNWVEKNIGCPSDTDIAALKFTQPPVSSAGKDTSVCALTYKLSGKRSVGLGLWSMANGSGTANFTDPFSDTSVVTVSSQGLYKLVWTEVNSAFCPISSDTVNIYFEQKPIPNAGPDFAVCGKVTNLQASPSFGTGQWTFVGDPTATVVFGSTSSATSLFGSDKFGAHPLIWSEINTMVCGVQTDTTVVTFVEQPIAEAGIPSQDICGTSYTLAAIPTVGYGQWTQVSGPETGTFANDFSANSYFSIPANSFGSYTLRWTETNADPCAASFDDINLNFYQQPTANAGATNTVCGLAATLGAIPSVGTGSWKLIPSGTQTASFDDNTQANANVTVNKYGTYQFVWTEVNSAFCSPDYDVVVVTFLEPPLANAGTDQINCGLISELNATPSSGFGYWRKANMADNITIQDTLNPKSACTAGTYGLFRLIWTETNGRECAPGVDTVIVEFTQQPLAKTAGNARNCGLTFQLDAIPSVGLGTWTTNAPDAVFSPDANNPDAVVTITTYGTYQFVWTEVNQAPCIPSADTISVEFIEPPTATLLTNKVETCAGDPVELTFSLTGTAPFRLMYTTNGGSAVTFTNLTSDTTITLNPTVTSTYRISSVIDGSGFGCSFTSFNPTEVFVNPLPTGLIGGNYGVCAGEKVSIPLTLTGKSPYRVIFSNTDTVTFNGAGPFNYVFEPGGLNSLGLTAISDSGCVGTVSPSLANITTHSLPQGNLSRVGNGNICAGQPITLKFDFTNGQAPYTAYWIEDTLAKIETAPTSSYSVTVYPPTGTYTVRFDSIRDANGCFGTGNSFIQTVYPLPTAAIAGNTLICDSSSSAVKFNFGPADSPGPWIVNYDSSSTARQTPTLNREDYIFLSPTDTTLFTFKVITDITSGCSSIISVPLLINVVPIPTLVVGLSTTDICINDSAYITFNYAGVTPFSVTLNNGIKYDGLQNGSTITVSPGVSSSYQVIEFADASGISCVPNITGVMDLTVHNLPPVDFNPEDTSQCQPLFAKFTNTTDPLYVATSGGSKWQFSNGGVAITDIASHQFASSGTYSVTLTVVSNQGCINSLTKPVVITIYPDPVADFRWTPEKPTLADNQVQFINQSEGSIIDHTWRIDGLTYTEFNPRHVFPTEDSGYYAIKLYVKSDRGCEDSIEKIIAINGELNTFIPSAFTPDGDGLNDVFIPSVAGADPNDYELLIFDRWGELIFQSKNPSLGWDGVKKGNLVKNDVYSWKVEFKDKYSVVRHKYSGKLHLIK